MALPTTIKTPGVYIDEKDAFPNSVVGVETSIPAFIGYTEKAEYDEKSIINKPIRVDSFKEFERFFGKGHKTTYNLNEEQTPIDQPQNYDIKLQDKAYKLEATDKSRFNLYDSIKFFYQNGGGSCFIISIGTFEDQPFESIQPFKEAIDLLEKEPEPTMIVIPDAVLFDEADDCYNLQNYMITHCGEQMNRVAILDIFNGAHGLNDPTYNPVDEFRDNITSNYLSYGAAYYPWLHTTIVQAREVNHTNLNKDGRELLANICRQAISNFESTQKESLMGYIDLLNEIQPLKIETDSDDTSEVTVDENTIKNVLSIAIPEYKLVMENLLKKKNLLPPSGAIAGIYTLVDSQRGVWKAPANVAVSAVVSPAVLIDYREQEDLNAPLLGKAINAIRPFIGLGTMVWGARTLDANSLDWRYINVRRTIIMIEQSIKFAVKAYVFEPNMKNTWVSVEAMITNFLTNLWKSGALAGAAPSDAFSVNVGLGTTMTATDILEGRMIIEAKVAVSRPAEFIVLTFQQQMQTS